MTLKKTFTQQLKIYLFGFFLTLVKLRLRWGPSKKAFMKKMLSGQTAKRSRNAIANYEPTEHDVFVPCFMKSGTNWMMQITQQIAYYGEAEFEHIHDLVAWPSAFPTTVPLDDPTPQQQSPTGLRIIKSHSPAGVVPYHEAASYILVIRDPKEVFVSANHFGGGFLTPQEKLSIQEDFELLMEGVYLDWAYHTASYWQWRDRPNVLLMSYRQLKLDPRTCIQRVAEVMGVSLTDEQLDRVVAKSDIAYMKKRPFMFSAPLPPIPAFLNKGISPLVREGKLHSADEVLSPAQKDAIDDHWRARLEELGSDFPYDKWFVTNRSRTTQDV